MIIYPLFQQVYRITPVTIAQITNGESAEMRNVTVSFRAGKYTSSALKSEVVPVIKRMKTFDIPLYVDFSSELLIFSENGMLSGEVVIEYELLGKKKNICSGSFTSFFQPKHLCLGIQRISGSIRLTGYTGNS